MPDSNPGPNYQPPSIVWADGPTPPGLAALPCPNCGAAQPKTWVLTVDTRYPGHDPLRLLRCDACTAHFYDSQSMPDYANPELIAHGCVPFYVQQNAGVSLFARILAQSPAPPGSAYLEVGCGYGFGLDFALRDREWVGHGVDPAPLSALGRVALDLPITLQMLDGPGDAAGTLDVIMASEVVEHVPSPLGFVCMLRSMLRPGGTLILTTPNGADIGRAAPPGVLIPLLSPSHHLVIQSEVSLEAVLRGGGFQQVSIQADGHSLVAFASDHPLALQQDPAVLRRAYRAYLEHRATTLDPGGDPFLGLAGRAYQEAVNDGEMDAAGRMWALLVPACRVRFGFDLDGLTALPAPIKTCGLEEMARLVPLNLGGLLYARGIHRLTQGTPRPGLEPQFLLAQDAALQMRRALAELALEDGQTEDIGWTAGAEALLCAASAGAPDVVERLVALPPAPDGGAPRRMAVLGRAVGSLVNAGQYDPAQRLVTATGLAVPAGPLSPAERDVLFSLSVLAIRHGGDASAARNGFARVRAQAPPGAELWQAALRGEIQALGDTPAASDVAALVQDVLSGPPPLDVGRWALTRLVNAGAYALAADVVRACGLAEPPPGGPLASTDRDVVFALAMLGLHGALPGDSRARFARVRTAETPGAPLWLAALRGELQAADQAGDAAGGTAFLAEVVLAHPDLPMGYPEMGRLVNAGHIDAARSVVAHNRLGTDGFALPGSTLPLDDQQRDTLFFLAVLDAQIATEGWPSGHPAQGQLRFARVRATVLPGTPLWWAALRGELQSLDLQQAQEDAATLIRAVLAEHPALILPDDIAARVATADEATA